MTDYYAEANRLISATDTRDWNDPSPYVDRRIAAAQVHATLALAEQQRIANLIALNEQWEKSEYPNLDAVSPVLRPEIARALRIETP